MPIEIETPLAAEDRALLLDIRAKLDALTAQLAPDQDELLSSTEAARLLNVNEDTIRRMAREGRLPVAKRIGRQMRFRRGDVTPDAPQSRSR